MKGVTRIDIPVLLPEITEALDECVNRLVRLLEKRQGVERVHVVLPDGAEAAGGDTEKGPLGGPAQLCLHYDPERLPLAQIKEIARLAGAEVTARFGHIVIPFRAVGAEDGGGRLESALRAAAGVTAAVVNFAGQVARVEYDRTRTDRPAIEAELGRAGVELTADIGASRPTEAATPAPAGEEQESWYKRNREIAWSAISGAFLLGGWLVERSGGQPAIAIALFVAAYFFGARDNLAHLLGDIGRGRFRFNIDLLMLVAAAGAAGLGEWAEGGLLLFLFSLGHALEHYALGRARNAIKALASLAPQQAVVIRGGRESILPIEQVNRGDQVVVKPAERIAVDGTVREGRSAVNQAPITGESIPVEKQAGDPVFAGSVNGEGALVIEVTAAVGDRTLDRVIQLVSEAETQKAPTQQFTDRFERWFVPLVLVADVLLIVVPPLIWSWSWSESIYRGMALLVAASPCALALGTPAAVLAGLAQAARKGVLIKGGAYLETLGTINSLALDKTGTITKGEPAVTDLVPANGVTADVLLQLAAAVEQRSQHPLARAVLKAAEERRLTVAAAEGVESVTGRGIRAQVGTELVEVGRLLMFEESGKGEIPAAIRDAVARLESAGRTTMIVRRSRPENSTEARDGWLGVLGIADEPRANVRRTLDQLRAAGIRRIVMLTGDNAGVGGAVGRAVGVDEVRAGLLPEDKVVAIRELAADGGVAMVGDGVNDAPALAHATVGIAMGGAGTAAALETADIALMADDLGRLPFAVGLSRKARSIIKQNLFLSLGVIAGLGIAAVAGIAGIGVAVIAHEGSTLIVIANGLRLLAYKDSNQ
ncbi:MAG: heavy metal translocating P-type ATPase [Gemmatimonadales bacterium]|nr:heavy metal translocating P-type ATPase [Gemmatimonadales bacterium]